jgi:hypothetical protein
MDWDHIDEMARKHDAFIASDGRGFRRAARILQSLWRESHGYPVGEHEGSALGSRLSLEFAEESLANYLTPGIRNVVRRALDQASSDQLFAAPRIYNDLLSSQPLCFNLFGELKRNLTIATEVFATLRPRTIKKVTDIQFEYSPGRSDPRLTGDRSAFDVFVQYETLQKEGNQGFFGIEVKYHEDLSGTAAPHRERYDEVAKDMGCFRPDSLVALRQQPLQQLWRDHLLVGITQREKGYAEGTFVLVYPAANTECRVALQSYRRQLIDSSSFDAWTLEEIMAVLSLTTAEGWVRELRKRYLELDAITAS